MFRKCECVRNRTSLRQQGQEAAVKLCLAKVHWNRVNERRAQVADKGVAIIFILLVVGSHVGLANESKALKICSQCHSGDEPDGGIEIGPERTLAALAGPELDQVYKAIVDHRMPPADFADLNSQERTELVATVVAEFRSRGLRSAIHAARRMTSLEFQNSLREILGVEAEFRNGLPSDPVSAAGYSNSTRLLTFSSLRMEAYLDAARDAVDRYVDWNRPVPEPLRYHIEFEDLFYANGDRYKSRELAPSPITGPWESLSHQRQTGDSNLSTQYGPPLGPSLPGAFSDDEQLRAAIPKLNQQYVALKTRLSDGEILVSVRASGTKDRLGRYPRMRVEAGITLGDGCSMDKRVLGEVDVIAPMNAPAVYRFKARLEDLPTKGQQQNGSTFDRLSVFDMDQIFISNITPDEEAVFDKGPGGYSNPQQGVAKTKDAIGAMREAGTCFLHLDCLQIEMFPGAGASPKALRWKTPTYVSSSSEFEQSLSQFIRKFMVAAYRRPVEKAELQNRLELFDRLQSQGGLEEAIRDTLAAILISPAHLLIGNQRENRRASYDLASRLSFALWLSPPDEELLQTAKSGEILNSNTRETQVRRMLEDEKFQRWTEAFALQWLGLARLDRTAISRVVHPFWDDDLKRKLLQQTLVTFDFVARQNRNCLELLTAEYAFLNDRLAEHYGLPAVTHGDLRQVRLPKGSTRGGLLGHGSLLSMNSDGKAAHPIRRGVWILDRLLASRPAPPPPNVPELEAARVAGETLSMRQQIELHPESANCATCHARIDPWGLVLEEFDATGRVHDLRPAVAEESNDSVALPNGHEIRSVSELQSYLRNYQSRRFARGLVEHVLTFVLGREPDFRDRLQVIEIEKQFEESGFQLKELLVAILTSQLFEN